MGILTRRQGKKFVISSDHYPLGELRRRPARRLDEPYHVWTGATWSSNNEEAMIFESLEDADDYVRANYSRVSA